jgi:hypothetical protein
MTDTMQEWKDRRFIVADPELGFSNTIIVLTDVGYWIKNLDELSAWCRSTPGVTNEGMTIVISDPQALTVFLLRWS